MAKRMRTTAVHGGERRDAQTGASSPNIVMSTTFAQEEPLGFSINAFEGEKPFIYTRWGNPTVRQLEEKLALLEEADACLAFASGMAATAAVFLTVLSSGDHLVISNVNYAGTAELVRQTLPRMNIDVTSVDTSDPGAVADAIRPQTRLVWVETPANPILRLTDIDSISKIAHDAGAKLAVDSTFATPVATRPITLGADYVVHSLTKYIGGHGDALGGAVIASHDDIARLEQEATVHLGGVISPFNAWLIMRGAATLPLRMRAHAEGAMAIAGWLESHAEVERVLYPGLPSHPQHELAVRQMDNFAGMISFRVRGGRDVARAMARDLSVIHYAVSLGHHRSLIYWIETDALIASSFGLEGEERDKYRADAGDGIFRLSVGLEDAQDLIDDLGTVLGV